MTEYIWVFNKDSLIIKPAPRKSTLFLRLIVLMFAMGIGFYICLMCLKQISVETMTKFESIKVIGRSPYEIQASKVLDIPSKHYPVPETFNRTECARNPVRFFAILSMQRSGSGWFESMLNSHKNVSSNGEIFSVKDRRANVSSIVQTLDKVYNLDWYSSASKNECSAATGFKWMLNQGVMDHHEDIVEYFNRRGVSTIFLFRRNLLRRMVSVLANSYDRYAKLLNGTHKSHVHSEKEADTLSKYKPMINCTKLLSDLNEMELTAAKAIGYFNSTRHMVLYYEDIVRNRKVLKDVEEFVGIRRKRLRSHQVKIHNGPLADLIGNWEDVKTTLTGTQYEAFLHADY